MSLSKARKILSFILMIIIALGGFAFFASSLTYITVLSQRYVSYVFDISDVTQQCRDNFNNEISVIEAKSGIPSRVFDAVFNVDSVTSDKIAQRLFGGHNTSLYSQSEIETFENLCKEYLEGNNLSYDYELIHNTALEAAQAYSDCFGMQNTDELAAFITTAKESCKGFIAAGLFVMLIAVTLMTVLYSKSYDIIFNITAAFTLQGFSFVFAALLCLIFKVGRSFDVTPYVYADALANCTKGACLAFAILGVAVAAFSLLCNVKLTKKQNDV